MRELSLEKRLVNYGHGPSFRVDLWPETEALGLLHEAKIETRLFMVLGVVLGSVISWSELQMLIVEALSKTMLIIVCLCGVSGAVIAWLLCWPFAGRSQYWRNVHDFIEAIRYAEDVTGECFERWHMSESDIIKIVEKVLSQELVPIFALQDKDLESASDLLAKWRRRHSQMQRLFSRLPQ